MRGHGVEHRPCRQDLAAETHVGLEVQPQEPIAVRVVVDRVDIGHSHREHREPLPDDKLADITEARGLDE
jgi:hypothetical protein